MFGHLKITLDLFTSEAPIVISKVYNVITVVISAGNTCNVFYLHVAGHVSFHFPILAGCINKFCTIINIRSNLHICMHLHYN